MKDSFVIYTKFEEQISLLSDAQAGVLFRALMCYQMDKEMPKMDGMTNMLFTIIRQQIDFDNEKYQAVCERNKNNGSGGGRPSKSLENKGNKPKKPSGLFGLEKNEVGFSENPTKPKKPDTDTDTDTDIYTPLYPPTGGKTQKNPVDLFFEKYPKYAKGRCDSLTSHMDFEALLNAFEKSSYCRKLMSFSQVLRDYEAIIRGDYEDKQSADAIKLQGFEKRAERERWYAERKAKAENQAESILKTFLKDEEFKQCHKRLRELPLEIAKAEVQTAKGDVKAKKTLTKLVQEESRLRLQCRGIIERNGMQEEDLQPKWHCRKCEDTGFLKNGKACDCYEKAGGL